MFEGASPEPLSSWSVVHCLLREVKGEFYSYFGAVATVPLDERQAKNNQGSLFAWSPFRLHLGQPLLPRSLLTWLLLAWLAELGHRASR